MPPPKQSRSMPNGSSWSGRMKAVKADSTIPTILRLIRRTGCGWLTPATVASRSSMPMEIFIDSWGSPGSGDGQLQLRGFDGDGYGDIEFAPDGTFYVLDPGNYRVQKFDADRNFVTSWGGFGTDPGQFQDPVSLLVTAAGTVLVVDDVRNDIQEFDADGQLIDTVSPLLEGGGGHNTINDAAIDSAGHVYVSDIPGYRVNELKPDGAVEMVFGGHGDADDQFSGQAAGLAVDDTGRLFVTEASETGRVLVFGSDGAYLAGWEVDDSVPWGIALDGSGNVYIANYLDNTVQQFRLPPPLGPEATLVA